MFRVRLQLVHAAIAVYLDGHILLQFPEKFGQVCSAIVLQDIDKLGYIPQDIGSNAILPIDVINQILDKIAQGKLFFVVFQPNNWGFIPIVRLVPNGEMGLRPIVGLVAVIFVNLGTPQRQTRQRHPF